MLCRAFFPVPRRSSGGIIRHGAKYHAYARSHREITVITRKAYGGRIA
jgi:acetyl-CoA carboxylase carboxyltransferase component